MPYLVGYTTPQDYGAAGDGTTDDTAAIQAAINAAPVVFFPPATYLTGTLTPRAGTTLLGVNAGVFTTPAPSAMLSTLKLKSGTNSHLLSAGTGVSDVQVRYLHLDGNKAGNSAGNLINVADSGVSEQADWLITDCFLENAPAIGIYGGVNRLQVQVLRSYIYGAAGDGVQWQAADCTLQNCSIGLAGGNGVTLGTNAWVAHINSCDIWSSTLVGVNSSSSANMVMITGCGIDRHQREGIKMVSGGQVTVVGCSLHSNSQAANNTYAHINTLGGDLSVAGTIFGTDSLPNNPSYAISSGGGTIREWANKLVTGSTVSGYINDATKVVNAFTGNILVGTTGSLGDNGVGEIALANAATVPTVAPTGGAVLYSQAGAVKFLTPAGAVYDLTNFVPAAATGLDNTNGPADQGLIAWTGDPAMTPTGATPASGGVRLSRIVLRRAATISNLWVAVTTAGSGMTAGQCFAGLYTASGTQVGVTADQSTSWASTGVKQIALTSSYTAAAGVYYVAVLANGTTPPQFAAHASPSVSVVNVNLTASTGRSLSGPSGQTTLPASITMSGNGLNSAAYWAAVS